MYDILRAIHILSGVFVGGVTLFELFILNPRLRRLGPAIQSTVVGSLSPAMGPAMAVGSIVLLGTGIAITLMLRDLASLFTSVWGWGMIVATIAVLAFMVNGVVGVVPTASRLQKLSGSFAGRAPTAQESKQLQQLSAKMDKLQNLQIVFILVGLAIMVMGRFL